MEFTFNVGEVFPTEISKIDASLIPNGFVEDPEMEDFVVAAVAAVLFDLGQRSAKAQGLKTAITDPVRLKQSDHVVYLLTDPTGANSRGTVIGFLKMGRKKLYLYDETGRCVESEPLCILDFYIHESMQRSGMGLKLFSHMLQAENTKPEYLAIDRPSKKLLCFMSKHYHLTKIIPQAYNFVVFRGFFVDNPYLRGKKSSLQKLDGSLDPTELPSSSRVPSAGVGRYFSQVCDQFNPGTSRIGRYAAQKPATTMGNILHDPSPKSPPRRSGIGFQHKLYYLEHIDQ